MRKRIDPTGFDSEMKEDYHLQVYEECFAGLVDKEIRLLELGVYQGKSLLLWRDYFEKGRIVGLDSTAVSIDDPTGRIRVYVGYQQDTALLDRIAREEAPEGFDVIIDDCSHLAEPTRIAFWHLFVNHLKPGGIYAVEDIGTGYMANWIDGGHYKVPRLPIQSLASSATKSSGVRIHTTQSLVDSLKPSFTRFLPNNIVQSFKRSRRLMSIYTSLRNLTTPQRYRRRIPSHMYGMVGFAKELMDVCARGDIINGASIQRIQISQNQVIVVKSHPSGNTSNTS